MPEDNRTDNRSQALPTTAPRTNSEEWPPWRGKKESFIDWRNAANHMLWVVFLAIGSPLLFLLARWLFPLYEYLPVILCRWLRLITGLLAVPAAVTVILGGKALADRIIEPND